MGQHDHRGIGRRQHRGGWKIAAGLFLGIGLGRLLLCGTLLLRCGGLDDRRVGEGQNIGCQVVSEHLLDVLHDLGQLRFLVPGRCGLCLCGRPLGSRFFCPRRPGGVDHEPHVRLFALDLQVAYRQVRQIGQFRADEADLLRPLEDDLDGDSSGEVDIQQAHAAAVHADQADDDHHQRDNGGQVALAGEVDFGTSQQPHHLQPGDPSALLGDVEDHPRTEDRGEHTQDHAQPEDNGETLDLVGSDYPQDGGGDQRGEVCVDDSGGSAAEAVADRHSQGGLPIELFADSFVYQHVGVHGHAHRKHQARQARQSERTLDRDHDGQDEDQVHQQRHAGHHAGEAVVKQHEHQHQQHRHGDGVFAAVDGILPQRGTDHQLADGLFGQCGGQGPGVEHVHQVVNLLLSEVAADFTPLEDRAADGGRRVKVSVQDDSQSAVEFLYLVGQVGTGELAEELPALRIEREVDADPPVAIRAGPGVHQVAAGDVEDILDDEDFQRVSAAPLAYSLHGSLVRGELFLPLLLHGGPPGQPFALVVVHLGGAFLLGPFDQRSVVAGVGQDAKFQGADAGHLVFDPLDLAGAGLGDDDFDLFHAVFADHHLFHATRIHPPADRLDQLIHVQRFVRILRLFLLFLVDLVYQDHTAFQVDAQAGLPARDDDRHAAGQCAEDQADLPAVVGHAQRAGEIPTHHKGHGQQGHGNQQINVQRHERTFPVRYSIFVLNPTSTARSTFRLPAPGQWSRRSREFSYWWPRPL